MTKLVLGLGNPILTDDGVGIRIAQEVRSWLTASGGREEGCAFAEASVGGLRLLEVLAGHDKAILADAIQTRDGMPGDVYRLKASDLRSSQHSGSTHDMTLGEALAFGRLVGMELPDDDAIEIIAVEVEDILTFGEGCTPAVEAAIPAAVQRVLEAMGLLLGDRCASRGTGEELDRRGLLCRDAAQVAGA